MTGYLYDQFQPARGFATTIGHQGQDSACQGNETVNANIHGHAEPLAAGVVKTAGQFFGWCISNGVNEDIYLAEPIGRGYDCGMRVAVEICKLMDRNPDQSMSDLRKALPKTGSTPTMSPYAADTEKYDILKRLVDKLVAKADAGEKLAGRAIKEVVTVNGARVILDNGSWGLVRASSNTPNLVVVCESPASEAEMRAIFQDIDAIIRTEEGVGQYDQTI